LARLRLLPLGGSAFHGEDAVRAPQRQRRRAPSPRHCRSTCRAPLSRQAAVAAAARALAAARAERAAALGAAAAAEDARARAEAEAALGARCAEEAAGRARAEGEEALRRARAEGEENLRRARAEAESLEGTIAALHEEAGAARAALSALEEARPRGPHPPPRCRCPSPSPLCTAGAVLTHSGFLLCDL
jgi:hypothetical protein